MKRRALVALSALCAGVALLVLATRAGPRDVYRAISSLCMTLSEGIAHPHVLALYAAAATVALLVAAGASGACRLVRTRRVVRDLLVERLNPASPRVAAVVARLGSEIPVDVVRCNDALSFCHGVAHPQLLLSTAMVDALDDDELEAVLRHELAHASRRDPLRTLAVQSLSSALVFVPFASGLAQAYLCSREIRADRLAVAEMGDVLPLASALQRAISENPAAKLGSLAVGALSATDIRIDHLLGADTRLLELVEPPSKLHSVVFAAATTLLLCLFLATAHAASGIRPCIPC